MKIQYKILAVSLPAAFIVLSLNSVIWPNMHGLPRPNASLIPYFVIFTVIEGLSFGVGVAFAIFGWKHIRRNTSGYHGLDMATFISIVWLLTSWWPHDNMHRVNVETNYLGLLRIEYMFHLTLVVAGFIIAIHFWQHISKSNA